MITKRRARSWILVGVLLWFAAVGLELLEAKSHLEDGKDELDEVASLVDTPEDLDLDEVSGMVSGADQHFVAAKQRLDSTVLWPLRPLPIIGRQLSSARHLTEAVGGVTGPAAAILDRLAGIEEVSEAAEDSDLLAALTADLTQLERAVDQADLGPDEGLLAPLAEARFEVASQFQDAKPQLDTALVVVSGLDTMTAGGSYMLLAANNGEMRLGSGMVLSVGVLQIDGVDATLGEFRSSESAFPVPASGVSDDDVEARWGFLSPDNDYRKLTYSARFESYVGPQALQMYEAETGDQLDGVVLVDAFVLEALLEIVGPVEVAGETYDSSNVVDYVLFGQYEQFSSDDRDDRQDRQAEIAAAAVTALSESEWDPLTAWRALSPLASGRHLLAYSADRSVQTMFSELGLDGELTGVEAGAFLLNVGASKLDTFVELETTVSTEDMGDGGQTVTFDIVMTNTLSDPESIPEHILGPWEWNGASGIGSYLGRLAVYAPAQASDPRFVGHSEPLEVFGPDGPVWVLATRVEVPAGATRRVRFAFDLPAGVERLTIEPSARYPAAAWIYEGHSQLDTERFELVLS